MADQKWVDRLEVKIDKQDERIDKIDISLTEIKSDLREHMRRTTANEESNKLLKQLVDDNHALCNKRISKLEKIRDNFHFLGWFLAGAVGLAEAIKSLFF